ncbi:MAG TPA: hypothetical protein VJV79_31370 [Polyangiaceae bacterium]|nr:hypothetical protein [Polyangiaceae bacterium]
MADGKPTELVRLDREGAQTLALAGSYARTLGLLAHRMQTVTSAGAPQNTTDLRSAALRLSLAANEAMAALITVIVQSARLDALAMVRPTQESKASEPHNR